MINGVCPNCGSNEIYTDINIAGRFGGVGLNMIVAKGGLLAPALVGFDNYLCATCGCLERYVTNPHDRQLIVKNWSAVRPD